ncbi:hypothetical protein [Mammaliicoccus sp. P-M59]|uniref:hypothetical protein n=1 Tax=Mammaliicoccus sp. P-M59 TaxID=2898718 RepID=UPI001EFC00F4|nr:hypothetical protein [Mammaliicoccus sp. P-M59]
MTNKQPILNEKERKILIEKLANAKQLENSFSVDNITQNELLELEYFMNVNILDLMTLSKVENGVRTVKFSKCNRFNVLFEI